MTGTPCLERRGRGGTWYFRRVVPIDLQRRGARPALRISLRTNAWEAAARKGRYLNAAADRIFDKARTTAPMLTQDELNQFMSEMLANELAAFEAYRPLIRIDSDEELKHSPEFYEGMARQTRLALARDDIEGYEQTAFSEAERQHLKIDPNSPEFHQIARATLRVLEQLDLATAKRLRGEYDDDAHFRALGLQAPRLAMSAVDSAKGPPSAARRPISEIYKECRSYQLDHREWTENSARSKDVSIRYFIEVVGDLRFDKITADSVAEYDRALRRQPANMGRGIYAGLTLPKAIELFEAELAKVEAARAAGDITAEEMAKKLAEPWAKRSEPNNQTKHINSLSSVITWANKVMRWNIPNYCDGFRLSKKARKKLGKKRERLPIDWLQSLLLSPMFTGHSPARKSTPGNIIRKDGDYWSVLIAVFQGCRLDEGAKLKPSDVFREHGIWCIRLNYDDPGKTEGGYRTVPVHSILIKLGLADHARKMRRKNAEWLFPEMTISKHHASRASNLTKRLLSYKRTLGLYERWKDQHAFRHTLNNWLRRSGVPEPVVNELLGWAREGMSDDQYYSESTLIELRAALEKYDIGIELGERNGEWQIVGAHSVADPGDIDAKRRGKIAGRRPVVRRTKAAAG